MTQTQFISDCKTLYHVSCGDSWESIKKHGLLCTADMFQRCGIVSDVQREAAYRDRYKEAKSCDVPGVGTIIVRDQTPLCWEGLRKAVEPDLRPLRWIDELNARLFFWVRAKGNPGRTKGANSLIGAALNRGTTMTLIEFDTEKLLNEYGRKAALTTFNVGYTLRKPKPRDLGSFQTIDEFSGPFSCVRELTIHGSIQDASEYATHVTMLDSNREQLVVYSA